MTKTLIERINEKCVIDETRTYNGTPCKIWHGKKDRGYGIVTVNGRTKLVHRAVYEHEFGKIPEDKIIRHMCHNKDCCEITHLQIGTPKDNGMDEVMAGKSARGEKNASAKLKQKDIIPIRNDTRSSKVIAKHYGVSTVTINAIKRKTLWGWVEDEKPVKTMKSRIKLTEQDVISIRRDNRLTKVIAEQYGVTTTHILDIKKRRKWGWVKDEQKETIKCSTKFRRKFEKKLTLEDFAIDEECVTKQNPWISLLERG